MNPTAFSAALAEVGGEALWRTNPVYCVDRLLARWERSDAEWAAGAGRLWNLLTTLTDEGVRLPPEALNRWAAGSQAGRFRPPAAAAGPHPRVVGLAVSADGRTGYVFPLRPAIGPGGWRIDPELPFKCHEIQDGLAALIQESGIADARAVPERLAFAFDNPTGLTARGDSMRMAAILSVLDHVGGYSSPLLRAAVALVESQPGGRLRGVSHVPEKLAAARRECGTLSLVIGPPGVDRTAGEVVWEVESFADLARRLHDAGLLAPLLDVVGPLTRTEVARVLERLRSLVLRESRYRAAVDLGERVRRCGFAAPPDPSAWVEFARLHALAYRHHGRFADAVTVGREAHERVTDLGDRGCDDEEADSAAEYAASLFSGHRFADVPILLRPWTELAEREPRRFRPLTRVKVWNTLARALAILGEGGWDDLFGRSLVLNRGLGDLENIDRTTHYRVHARLRHCDPTGARGALAEAPALSEAAGAGNAWAAFLHANLARLEGREWADPALDERLAAGEKPYSAWVYVQATARQSHRDREDSLRRLDLALALLRHEAGGAEGNVCNLYAALLELNSAARLNCSKGWAKAGDEVRGFLSNSPDHQAHYGTAVGALPASPCLPASEALLDLVPYF